MDKKIVFVIGSMGWGGAEKVISILANDYAANCWNVKIICLLSSTISYELNPKIEVVSFAREKQKRFKNVSHWISKLNAFFKTENPNIVVSFVCRINLLVIFAKLLGRHKFKLIISERSDPLHDGRGLIAKILSKTMYKHCDALICQTTKCKDFFPLKIQKKTHVLLNPIYLKCNSLPFSERKKIIINAARYDEAKNQLLLIDSFSDIVAKKLNKNYILCFYGSGNLKQKLIERVKTLNMENHIFVYDSIIDIHNKIAESSVFCLTSNYEGLSNSLIEALLLNVPSISTDVNGASDVIENNKNGFIIPVGNKDKLTESLLKIISSDEVLKQMINNCDSSKLKDKITNAMNEYKKVIEG